MTDILVNTNYNAHLTDNGIFAYTSLPVNNFRFSSNMNNVFNGCTNLRFNLDKYRNAFELVTNMASTFDNCSNIRSQPVCGPMVNNMNKTYFRCYNLIGQPVCGPNVTDMFQTYSGCNNLTGQPVCGDNVTKMFETYRECSKLTGQPVCGPKVTNMIATYSNCNNLTGNPVCGPNVTTMANAYYNCQNLTGNPVCGPKVTSLSNTYSRCSNIRGNFSIPDSVTSAGGAFQLCTNLEHGVVTDKITSAGSMYEQCYRLIDCQTGDKLTGIASMFANSGIIKGACGKVSNNASNLYKSTNRLLLPILGPNVNNGSQCLMSTTAGILSYTFPPKMNNFNSGIQGNNNDWSKMGTSNHHHNFQFGPNANNFTNAFCRCSLSNINIYFYSNAITSGSKKMFNNVNGNMFMTNLFFQNTSAVLNTLNKESIFTDSVYNAEEGSYYNQQWNIKFYLVDNMYEKCGPYNYAYMYKNNNVGVFTYNGSSWSNTTIAPYTYTVVPCEGVTIQQQSIGNAIPNRWECVVANHPNKFNYVSWYDENNEWVCDGETLVFNANTNGKVFYPRVQSMENTSWRLHEILSGAVYHYILYEAPVDFNGKNAFDFNTNIFVSGETKPYISGYLRPNGSSVKILRKGDTIDTKFVEDHQFAPSSDAFTMKELTFGSIEGTDNFICGLVRKFGTRVR